MRINGANYELIKIYPNPKFREKDMFLLQHEKGYKTCFYRVDLDRMPSEKLKDDWLYSTSETEQITELLKQGMTPTEISKKKYRNKSQSSIYNKARRIKRGLKDDKQ